MKKIKWEKELLEEVVKKSNNIKEALENLGLRSAGGNFKTIKKYLEIYNIDTSHFIKKWESLVNRVKDGKTDLSQILTENSKFSRTHLKNRLYEDGLKERFCELCGQDENWNGMKISLILDHINGIHNDNRLHNLRIVCPNCNAGLETHCGKNIKYKIENKNKCKCGKEICKKSYKCNKCQQRNRRKIERPVYDVLIKEVLNNGYSSTGRKYSVSDNTIRKWIKSYEKELKELN